MIFLRGVTHFKKVISSVALFKLNIELNSLIILLFVVLNIFLTDKINSDDECINKNRQVLSKPSTTLVVTC